jgi:hypothetical protein
MSTISPDQLPSPTRPIGAPVAPAAVMHRTPQAWKPQMPQAPRRPLNTRLVTMVLGGLVVLGGTAAAVKAQGNGPAASPKPARTTERTHNTDPQNSQPQNSQPQNSDPQNSQPEDSQPENSGGGSGTELSSADLDRTYTMVFGVHGSAATLECVAAQIDQSGGDLATAVADWTDGTQFSLADAQQIFTPFAACAPDQDFLAEMVPAAVAVVGDSTGQACVADILVTFGVAGRAEAEALAYADPTQFQSRMYSTFVGCAS